MVFFNRFCWFEVLYKCRNVWQITREDLVCVGVVCSWLYILFQYNKSRVLLSSFPSGLAWKLGRQNATVSSAKSRKFILWLLFSFASCTKVKLAGAFILLPRDELIREFPLYAPNMESGLNFYLYWPLDWNVYYCSKKTPIADLDFLIDRTPIKGDFSL